MNTTKTETTKPAAPRGAADTWDPDPKVRNQLVNEQKLAKWRRYQATGRNN
jgi:hypothetical protein